MICIYVILIQYSKLKRTFIRLAVSIRTQSLMNKTLLFSEEIQFKVNFFSYV